MFSGKFIGDGNQPIPDNALQVLEILIPLQISSAAIQNTLRELINDLKKITDEHETAAILKKYKIISALAINTNRFKLIFAEKTDHDLFNINTSSFNTQSKTIYAQAALNRLFINSNSNNLKRKIQLLSPENLSLVENFLNIKIKTILEKLVDCTDQFFLDFNKKIESAINFEAKLTAVIQLESEIQELVKSSPPASKWSTIVKESLHDVELKNTVRQQTTPPMQNKNEPKKPAPNTPPSSISQKTSKQSGAQSAQKLIVYPNVEAAQLAQVKHDRARKENAQNFLRLKIDFLSTRAKELIKYLPESLYLPKIREAAAFDSQFLTHDINTEFLWDLKKELGLINLIYSPFVKAIITEMLTVIETKKDLKLPPLQTKEKPMWSSYCAYHVLDILSSLRAHIEPNHQKIVNQLIHSLKYEFSNSVIGTNCLPFLQLLEQNPQKYKLLELRIKYATMDDSQLAKLKEPTHESERNIYYHTILDRFLMDHESFLKNNLNAHQKLIVKILLQAKMNFIVESKSNALIDQLSDTYKSRTAEIFSEFKNTTENETATFDEKLATVKKVQKYLQSILTIILTDPKSLDKDKAIVAELLDVFNSRLQSLIPIQRQIACLTNEELFTLKFYKRQCLHEILSRLLVSDSITYHQQFFSLTKIENDTTFEILNHILQLKIQFLKDLALPIQDEKLIGLLKEMSLLEEKSHEVEFAKPNFMATVEKIRDFQARLNELSNENVFFSEGLAKISQSITSNLLDTKDIIKVLKQASEKRKIAVRDIPTREQYQQPNKHFSSSSLPNPTSTQHSISPSPSNEGNGHSEEEKRVKGKEKDNKQLHVHPSIELLAKTETATPVPRTEGAGENILATKQDTPDSLKKTPMETVTSYLSIYKEKNSSYKTFTVDEITSYQTQLNKLLNENKICETFLAIENLLQEIDKTRKERNIFKWFFTESDFKKMVLQLRDELEEKFSKQKIIFDSMLAKSKECNIELSSLRNMVRNIDSTISTQFNNDIKEVDNKSITSGIFRELNETLTTNKIKNFINLFRADLEEKLDQYDNTQTQTLK